MKPQYAWVIYRLTISNVCGSYSHDYKFVADGICITGGDLVFNESRSGIFISPNPVKESFRVSLNTFKKIDGIKEIIVKNSMGIVVKRFLPGNSSSIQDVNIQNLPSGVYIVWVFDGTKWLTGKIVKQ